MSTALLEVCLIFFLLFFAFFCASCASQMRLYHGGELFILLPVFSSLSFFFTISIQLKRTTRPPPASRTVAPSVLKTATLVTITTTPVLVPGPQRGPSAPNMNIRTITTITTITIAALARKMERVKSLGAGRLRRNNAHVHVFLCAR